MNGVIKKQFNNQVALVRAFSVLVVLGYHFFPSYFPWGFLGVDWFFFISGYLMLPLISRSDNFLLFIYNRINRLYPALLLFTLLYMTIGYLFLLDDELIILLKSSVGSLTHLQNFFENSREGYFVDSAGFRPFLNVWSLSVEFQIYIFYAFIFLFVLSKSSTVVKMRTLITIATISLFSYVSSQYIYELDPFFISPFRLWEFIMGSILYLVMSNKNEVTLCFSKFKMMLIYIVLFILAISLFVMKGEYRTLSTIISIVFCFIFIMAVDLSKAPKIFINSYVYIGSISYSIYLFHYPAIEFLEQFVGSPSIGERVSLILMIFLVAHLVDRIISPRLVRMKKSALVFIFSSLLIIGGSTFLRYNVENLNRYVINKNEILNLNNNFEINYKFKCDFFTNNEYEDERCRLGSNLNSLKSPGFLIVGDSLSNSITTMFESIADKDNVFDQYIQIGKGYCPIVFEFGGESCKKFRQESIEYLDKFENVPIVISAQWSLYFKTDDIIVLNERKNQLIQFVEMLNVKGFDVYLVHSVPLGARPRTCVSRAPWSNIGDCDIAISTVNNRSEGSYDIIESIAEQVNAKIFDPKKYMCDSISCFVYKDGDILYLDDSHLSVDGGRYLGRKSREWWETKLYKNKL